MPQYGLRISVQPLYRIRYCQYEQVTLPCYRKYVYSVCHYSGLDLILKLYHGGRKQLVFYLFCFTSKAPICMMLPVFFFFNIYCLIVLQTSGVSPCSASFTAIVYLFLSLQFCSITSVCHRNQLSPVLFYFCSEFISVSTSCFLTPIH